jgi:hypothetical protein
MAMEIKINPSMGMPVFGVFNRQRVSMDGSYDTEDTCYGYKEYNPIPSDPDLYRIVRVSKPNIWIKLKRFMLTLYERISKRI